MPMESEGAMKISASRASKRAPTWHSCMTTQKSLSGQPLDQVWIRLARKGFWGSHTAMSCGGSFWSSWRADFHGTLRFHWHFFTSLDCHLERCVVESFQWNDISLPGKSRVGSENWLPNQSRHKDVAVANTFRALSYSPIVITRNCNHRVEHFENRIEA